MYLCYYCGKSTHQRPIEYKWNGKVLKGIFPSCCSDEKCIEQWDLIKKIGDYLKKTN